jgi:hypothetical protein
MKYFKSKTYLTFFWTMVLGLLCIRPLWAADQNISFSQETLLSDSELSIQSGQGADGAVGIRSNAQLSNNVINVAPGGSVTNGNNFVGDQVFSGVDGIPTVVQNSGNNVIIQNSTIVNMSFQ